VKSKIVSHYAQGKAEEKVREALAACPLEDTALLDEFHVRGREGTASLVSHLGLSPEDFVLDCGCGAGGALRWISQTYGSRVLGVDITLSFLQAARYISLSQGMREAAFFVAADGLRLPFGDATFSVVLCQHVTMNIPDKGALFREWWRVLKSGGKVALNEIVKVRGEPDYPVPWAGDETMSYLVGAEELRGLLMARGFDLCYFEDTTALGLNWFARAPRPVSNVNLRLLMGEEIGRMSRNLKAALADGRLGMVEVVARKVG